jgi:hypothetical protein
MTPEALGFSDASYLLHPGVYILMRQRIVIYVGQSTEPFRRVGTHYAKKHFDEVFFIRCDQEDLDRVERETIEALKPRLNVAYNAHNRAIQRIKEWKVKQEKKRLAKLEASASLKKRFDLANAQLDQPINIFKVRGTVVKLKKKEYSEFEKTSKTETWRQIEANFKQTRDRNMQVSLPKLKFMEGEARRF